MRTGMGTYANGIRISGCSTDRISVRVRSPRDARKRERESFSSSSQEASAQERETEGGGDSPIERERERERERIPDSATYILWKKNFVEFFPERFNFHRSKEARKEEREEKRREEAWQEWEDRCRKTGIQW